MLTQIAQGVLVHESEFIKSNAVVVQGGTGVLLIDPGITTEDMAEIVSAVSELGQSVAAGFSTHAHWDHLLWDANFGDVPRFGTTATASAIDAFLTNPLWRGDVAESLPPGLDVPLDLFGLISGVPGGSTNVPWDGPAVRIIEHDAHATGHAALLFEEGGVLVAGDMFSNHLVPMLNLRSIDPIGDYLAGLAKLEEVAGDVDIFVPGHGTVGDGDELRVRIDRDRAYVHALRDGTTPDDPRLGPSAQPGYEWVTDVHAGQVQGLARRVGEGLHD